MATRQYIGARYVPKFYTNSVDGTTHWEANVVYDPLIYVTLTNGHMYISKKQVPATVGTPASNAEYWLDVGSYNGFIEELQDEIDNINSEIQTLTKLTAKPNIMIVTDSYGMYANASSKKFNQIVEETTGYNCDILFKSGAGFANGDLVSEINNYTGDGSIYNTLIFVCGANDELSSEADILSGMANAKTAITTKFPNVNHIAVMCCGLSFKYGDGHTTTTRKLLAKNYKNGCEKNNFAYITNSEYILRNTTLLNSDFLHPSYAGIDEIAKKICEYLIAGGFDVDYDMGIIFTPVGGSADYQYRMTRHNNEVQIVNTTIGGYFYYTSNNMALDQSDIKIADLDNSLICNDVSGTDRYSAPASGFYRPNNDATITHPLTVSAFVYNKEFHARLTSYTGNATPDRTFITPTVLRFYD